MFDGKRELSNLLDACFVLSITQVGYNFRGKCMSKKASHAIARDTMVHVLEEERGMKLWNACYGPNANTANTKQMDAKMDNKRGPVFCALSLSMPAFACLPLPSPAFALHCICNPVCHDLY